MKKIVCIGSGGHFRPVLDAATLSGYNVIGVVDLNFLNEENIFGVKVFDKIESIYEMSLLSKLTYKKLLEYNKEYEELNSIYLQEDLSNFDEKKIYIRRNNFPFYFFKHQMNISPHLLIDAVILSMALTITLLLRAKGNSARKEKESK